MLFTLEALRARHGDSLIVHFGETERPQLIVIDGGPSGVYKDAFRPRLDQLVARVGVNGKLRIEILMVSHLDDDHLRGVLDLSAELLEEKPVKGLPFDVRTLWHNSFDDLLGNDADELTAGLAEAPARIASAEGEAPPWSGESEAVIASVPQSRKLRDNTPALGWKLNQPFNGFAMAPAAGGRTIELGPLRLTVILPLASQLEALQKEWKKELQKLKKSKKAKAAEDAAVELDDSVYNLSSIVCLAELNGKTMLLTGDARGDHILEGLAAAKLLNSRGEIKVDILKLPHHGSDRNVDAKFFSKIQARQYVVSGDGRDHNPEPRTFKLISAARDDDDFVLHLTYKDCKEGVREELERLFEAERQAGRKYEVHFRPEDELSLRVDLLDELKH